MDGFNTFELKKGQEFTAKTVRDLEGQKLTNGWGSRTILELLE
jgi:hypothetical protein